MKYHIFFKGLRTLGLLEQNTYTFAYINCLRIHAYLAENISIWLQQNILKPSSLNEPNW